MTEKTGSRYVFGGVVAVLVLALAYQHFEIRALRSQVAEIETRAQAASGEAEKALAKSKNQESRLEALERRSEQKFGTLPLPSAEGLAALGSGYYRLTTNTSYDPDNEPDADETPDYTITHITMAMDFESYATRLHVGLARSGLTPMSVYFDYDDDGRIDVDMALDFVRDIPVVGARLAGSYDPDVAQNLYAIFVGEAADAEYTSADDLANDAETASSYLWEFVQQKYDAIEAWVLEKLERRSDGSKPADGEA